MTLVLGNFDGVHSGHRAVLDRAREMDPQATIIAVTFWPHPAAVVRPDAPAPLLLSSLIDRISLLRDAGADDVKVVDFTPDLAALTPREFVESELLPLHPSRIVVGENYRFGHKASGDVATLAALGKGPDAVGDYEVTALPLLGDGTSTTCSTTIRALLTAGEVEEAAEHLGRPFRFSGTVVKGFQRGRELGFPTANLPVPVGRAVPADGIYAGWVRRTDSETAELWPAAISVGTNPTFDDVEATVVEAHVLDRDDLELYGVPLVVDFVKRLRGNVKFDGLDELMAQIGRDVDESRRVLGLG